MPARQRLDGGFAIELRDRSIELVEGAPETLSILLREFRQLGANEAAQQTDRHSQSSNQHCCPKTLRTALTAAGVGETKPRLPVNARLRPTIQSNR